MIIRTGTPETRTEHSKALAAVGVGLAVGIPALLTIGGYAATDWDGISWIGAVVWGLVATAVMTAMDRISRSEGMTRMDMPDLLGSLVAAPGTGKSRRTGMVLHFVNGGLLAVGWAYTMALLQWPATWVTGMVWGTFVAVLAILLLSSIGGVHPKMRAGLQHDPGMAGTNFGSMTPVGLLVSHMVYGLVLGLLYATWPLGG